MDRRDQHAGQETAGFTGPRLAAGFWERCAAVVIDAFLVYACLTALESALVGAGVYIQFELSLAVVAASYAVVGVGWKGRTIGKALCGLAVQTPSGEHLGFTHALVRETLGKALSALPLFLGFFWAGFRRDGRAWHDIVVRTRVVRYAANARRALAAQLLSLAGCCLFIGIYVWDVADLYQRARAMAPSALSSFVQRDPSTLIEAASISAADEDRFVRWLDLHAKDPREYAVVKSRAHRVVIFGETHGKKEPLRLLNELIPRLYEEAGITCLAMEACLAQDNAALDRLVTGDEFDAQLALQIARHHPWRRWGWKGYWDVFETVWRLNRALPPGEKRMRVVGLDLAIDLPSVALAGIGDVVVDGPLVEKLRALRVARQLPHMLLRDAFMAQQVEKEILGKGERGIVWIGAAHSSIHCRNPGPRRKGWGRMGFMLRQRYGDAVFQVRVHDVDLPVTVSDPDYDGPDPALGHFIERVMARRGHLPVAFDTAGSPFQLLRDGGCWDYHFDSRLSLGDVSAGYLYLAPGSDLTRCEWLPGYITVEMFVTDKPFYRALGRRSGRDVRSAEAANQFCR